MLQSASQLIETIPAPIALTVGIGLLLAGGHWLVEGSVRIARVLGISTLLIGLTVVAFGTSSPELAFNITAALAGNGELSFGNVVGSNIANIALVIGVAAMIRPLDVHGRVVRAELPLLIVVSAALLVLAWLPLTRLGDADRERLDLVSTVGHALTRPDGILLLAGFGLCGWLWFRMGRRDRADPLAREAVAQAETETGRASFPLASVLFVVGLIALVIGGRLAKVGAVGFAKTLGLSEAFIGLTVVAIATSLPELVTSAIAVRKGHTDLAIGNVVGSNQFNILLVLGVTSIVGPVPVPAHGWWDLALMLGLTLALMPIIVTNQRRVVRWEGVCLLITYFSYLTLRLMSESS